MSMIPREDRLFLAATVFGLYSIGRAPSRGAQIDENCAMDNAGVPYYDHQLTIEMQDKLDELHKDVAELHVKYNIPVTIK